MDLESHLQSNFFPNNQSAFTKLCALHDKPPSGASASTGTAAKVGPLTWLAIGLDSVGRTAHVAKGGRLPPGPWCQSAPLWANPLLGELATCGPFAALASLLDLRTLDDLGQHRHQLNNKNS